MYDDKLKYYQNLPIKFCEIGIMNGGSLEIFSKYFSNAKLILGCDIDPKCKNLNFNEANIKLIVGNVNNEEVRCQIKQYGKFDIIIDDGSHQSDDIIKTFCNYFKYLNFGGVYIIEDLHCSYQREHKGGLFFPISSINFLKKIVDIINHEHWGVEKKKEWLLRGFVENYKIDIENVELEQISSIEFINSLCFIKKNPSKENKIGTNIVVGENAEVVTDRKKLHNLEYKASNQNMNPWSNNNFLPEEELEILKNKFKK